MLAIQNYNVYHANVLQLCNFTVLGGSVLLLTLRLIGSQLRVLKEQNPVELQPEQVAAWALLASQVAGTGAWLARHLIDQQRWPRVVLFVGIPLFSWVVWRLLLWYRIRREDSQRRALRGREGLGGDARRSLRLVLLQMALIAEHAAVSAYVVGVLPAVYASDPHLFFDRGRCALLAVTAAFTAANLLLLWTLRTHLPHLRALWRVLGHWKPSPSNAATSSVSPLTPSPRPWDPLRSYAPGSMVSHEGRLWTAVGPYDSNLARPGSRSAALLHAWLGANPLRLHNAIIAWQVVLTALHLVSALTRRHYVADVLVVAVYCYPVLLLFMGWRSAAASMVVK